MSNEATIQASLQVLKTDSSSGISLIDYNSGGGSFNATVVGTKGPCVGSIRVPTSGKDVNLSELTTPGLVRLKNQDPLNFVQYGIRDPISGFFYPLGEILPGESYVLRFSRNLQEEYTNTGTGTSAPINFFHIKADTAACVVLVEAFEA